MWGGDKRTTVREKCQASNGNQGGVRKKRDQRVQSTKSLGGGWGGVLANSAVQVANSGNAP